MWAGYLVFTSTFIFPRGACLVFCIYSIFFLLFNSEHVKKSEVSTISIIKLLKNSIYLFLFLNEHLILVCQCIVCLFGLDLRYKGSLVEGLM